MKRDDPKAPSSEQDRLPQDRLAPPSKPAQRPPPQPPPIARQPVKAPGDPELERALQEVRSLPAPEPLDRLPTLAAPTTEANRIARLEVAIRDVRSRLLAAEAILNGALREG